MSLWSFDGLAVQAKNNKILDGIYANDISLGEKTEEEATKEISQLVEDWLNTPVTLLINDQEVVITPADAGFFWKNPEIIKEAAALGHSGNIVNRYKVSKDLKYENKVLELSFECDKQNVRNLIIERCEVYNQAPVDAILNKVEDGFTIEDGQDGIVVDEDAAVDQLSEFLCKVPKEDAPTFVVPVAVEKARGEQELSQIQDVLGTFTTSYKTSGASRSANVQNGCSLINGTLLYPGDEFSTYDTIAPFSSENGYYLAGSYMNGQVVESLGGGICQVSTTLYNAVLLAELDVVERHCHSMIVTYVDPSADAAISESAGKDFRFVNNTDYPIYIEGYTTSDKHITFIIYGKETREESHSVKYVSEVVSKTVPENEVCYADASLPLGRVTTQSAHIGYKANLWKVTYENGEEVSREMVNSSVYNPSPRQATFGVATDNPDAYSQMMAAIGTNNIDYARSVAAALAAGEAAPAPPTPVAEEGNPAENSG